MRRYTQDEWLAIFDQAVHHLSINTRIGYDTPRIGTTAFAETIDHTLLKVEATGEQVDVLCGEARRYGFKVGLFFVFFAAVDLVGLICLRTLGFCCVVLGDFFGYSKGLIGSTVRLCTTRMGRACC